MPTAARILYQILGVSRKATPEQITGAFRRRSLKLHPDRNPGDEAAAGRFKELSAAYEVLKDPARRAKYDATGETAAGPGDGPATELLHLILAETCRLLAEQDRNPAVTDVLALMRGLLAKRREQITQNLRAAERAVGLLEAMRDRWTGGELLADLTGLHVRQTRETIARMAADRDRTDAALRLLTGYGYRIDPALGAGGGAMTPGAAYLFTTGA